MVGKERQPNAESSLTASSIAALASSMIKLDALKDVCVTIAGPSGSNLVFLVVEGPQLWVGAKGGDASLDKHFSLTHGAGQWLTDGKCTKFLEDNPGKAFKLNFLSDQALVVLEDKGTDSSLMTLRELIRKMEKDGNVDLVLGGHKYNRPASVSNGQEADRFDVTPDGDLCWRPNTVQAKNAKLNNIMSIFEPQLLEKCTAISCVWRMRLWKAEKLLAAAKPLWKLRQSITLKDTECVRIL